MFFNFRKLAELFSVRKLIFSTTLIGIIFYQIDLNACINKSLSGNFSRTDIELPFVNDTATGIITIKVIETAGTDMVKYVGWSNGEDFTDGKIKFGNTPVYNKSDDGYFRIDSFITRKNKIAKKFDYLLLFDEAKKLIGHITYEYYPKKEGHFIRQLILFLHNSKFDCYDKMARKHFPYSKESPYYAGLFGGKWTYFSKEEYPVTMLIPPDYKDEGKKEFSGNKFPENFDKQPTLFIHGLTGKYNTYSKAKVENNETSYWWMEVKQFNNSLKHTAWQVYYPFDANLDFIAKWLKYDIEYLNKLYNKELNIITHSMGGLVAMELITSDYFNAKDVLNRVFLSQPPLHGSLGGNKQYRTGRGRVFQMLGFDREAPSIRDMSYGSDFYYNLHNRKWPSLDDDKYLTDDYFVLIGTTQDEYKLPKMLHEEAEMQTDGIVAMSSASLMEHNIRFATFEGNHDDGRGCWSAISPKEGKGFLAEITQEFFTKDIAGFQRYLHGDPMVETYIDYRTNKLKIKYKLENVNLKQGSYTIRLKRKKGDEWNDEILKWDDLIVLSDRKKKVIMLCPKISGTTKDEKFINRNQLEDVIKLYPEHEGYLSLNKFTSEDYISYFFTKKPDQVEDCVSGMPAGNYKVLFYFSDLKICIDLGMLKFRHLKTALAEFDLSKHKSPFFDMNLQTSFSNYIPKQGEKTDSTFVPDTLITIHKGAKKAIFQIISVHAQKSGRPFFMRVKNPNNYNVSSKLSSVTWVHNPKAAYKYYIIDNPTPGKWSIGGRVSSKSSKRMYYSIKIHQELGKDDLKAARKLERKEHKELREKGKLGKMIDGIIKKE